LIDYAIEMRDLHGADFRPGLVFDQEFLTPKVAWRSTRHLALQRHLGTCIDNLGRSADDKFHELVSLAAFVPAM